MSPAYTQPAGQFCPRKGERIYIYNHLQILLIVLSKSPFNITIRELHQRHEQHIVDANPAQTRLIPIEVDSVDGACAYPFANTANLLITHTFVRLHDVEVGLCPVYELAGEHPTFWLFNLHKCSLLHMRNVRYVAKCAYFRCHLIYLPGLTLLCAILVSGNLLESVRPLAVKGIPAEGVLLRDRAKDTLINKLL